MALIYRSVKGSKLSSAEGDGNTHNLDDRLTAVEGALPTAGRGIASITQASPGAPLYVTYTDASVDGPFSFLGPELAFLPWQPDTLYSEGQFIVDPGNTAVYGVRLDHTSAATFDPGANEGTAGDIYELLLEINSLPTAIVSPVDGEILRYRSDTSGDTWRNEALSLLSVSAPSEFAGDSLILDGSFSGTYQRCTGDGASDGLIVISVLTDATLAGLALPATAIGDEFTFRAAGDGTLMVVPQNDTDGEAIVTPPRDGYDLTTPYKGATFTLKKIAADTYDMVGAPGGNPV